jgi:hypothetical protein
MLIEAEVRLISEIFSVRYLNIALITFVRGESHQFASCIIFGSICVLDCLEDFA